MQIGSLQLDNRVVLAPMAGITDLPYRLLMKTFGAGLVFSEMVSAKGLIYAGKRTRELLTSAPAEHPLGIQLFGSDPQALAEATRLVADDGELFDINMGCPVNKVVKDGSGSALMKDPPLIGRIVAAVRAATDKPLTVKIRSGWDFHDRNFLEVAKIAEREGADAVTLHPRTRSQGFGGQADWRQLAELKQSLGIPVIGSGDIFTPEDALRMVRETGCDGVMIGRGGYGNPWLIRDTVRLLEGAAAQPFPDPAERLAVARQHQQLQIEIFGAHKALFEMRKHLCWYARGLDGAAAFRSAINQAASIEEQSRLITEFFTSNLDT